MEFININPNKEWQNYLKNQKTNKENKQGFQKCGSLESKTVEKACDEQTNIVRNFFAMNNFFLRLL